MKKFKNSAVTAGTVFLLLLTFQNCSNGFENVDGSSKDFLSPNIQSPSPNTNPTPGSGPSPGPSPTPNSWPAPVSALTHVYLNSDSVLSDRACSAEYVATTGFNKEPLCSQSLGTAAGNVISDVRIVAQGEVCPAGYQVSGTHLSWHNSGAPKYDMPVCLKIMPSATATRFITDFYRATTACAPGDLEIGHEQWSNQAKLCARFQDRDMLPPSSITSFVSAEPVASNPQYFNCPTRPSPFAALNKGDGQARSFPFACPSYQSKTDASQVITEVALVDIGAACPSGMQTQGTVGLDISGANTPRFELCARFAPARNAMRALQNVYWSVTSSIGRAKCRTGEITLTTLKFQQYSQPTEISYCARF